jgi:hypothetical protein
MDNPDATLGTRGRTKIMKLKKLGAVVAHLVSI